MPCGLQKNRCEWPRTEWLYFFFSSRRRHTRLQGDWSSDVCSSDLAAQIMPLKAFEADGTAHLFDILRAIYYAVDHGAKVINMSFSTEQRSAELKRSEERRVGKEGRSRWSPYH